VRGTAAAPFGVGAAEDHGEAAARRRAVVGRVGRLAHDARALLVRILGAARVLRTPGSSSSVNTITHQSIMGVEAKGGSVWPLKNKRPPGDGAALNELELVLPQGRHQV
jgi:hypothetical protein